MIVDSWTPNSTAKWDTIGKSLYKGVDPEKVAGELYSIGDEFTPSQIVGKAKDPKTELHKCFTWDNDKAADLYRLQEARYVTHHLVIEVENPEKSEPVEYRIAYQTQSGKGYEPLEYIIKSEDKMAAMLQRAKMELIAFKNKYKMLSELSQLFNDIDQLMLEDETEYDSTENETE